ncbi:MAG: hypothetical protein H7319_13185 [Spirosoma sp.]|nr:hypothetical protein [Spirosoma sp.]
MLKRNVCRLATIVCGLVTIIISNRLRLVSWYWPDNQPVGWVLGLLSAIFATQWIHYQKQIDAVLDQPRWPAWLRRLLY